MIFDRELVKQAWARSSGMCECKRIGCQHPGGRCTNAIEEKKFNEDEVGGWYVRPINEFGPEKLFNVEAVCAECFNKVKQTGKAKLDTISSDRSDTLTI